MKRLCYTTTAFGLCVISAFALVHRVPSEYPTIGSAFGNVSDNDTVLVALGEYYEGLITPAVTFWLIGDVPPDTGAYPRPLIDVSRSPDSLDMPCLTAVSGSDITVERFHFQTLVLNDSLPDVGGVYVQAAHIRFAECLFDSTRSPIRRQTWIGGVVELERCIFRNNSGIYVRVPTGAVDAYQCRFQGGGAFYHVEGGSGTVIDSCSFSENTDHAFLNLFGSGMMIRSCTFGPGLATGFNAMYLHHFSGVFEDNLITTLDFGGAVMDVQIDTAAAECLITGNTFMNLHGVQPISVSPPVWIRYEVFHPAGHLYEISQNVFVDCSTGMGAKAVIFQGNAHVAGNHFLFNSPSWPAVLVGDQAEPAEVRDNLFLDNGWGTNNWPTWNGNLDARWNWWGDSTGPFEATNNPEGLGDTVGSHVLFDPWLTDSLIDQARETLPPLPEKFALESYPNPFNPETRLRLTVPEPGRYRLELYNLVGRKVRDLFDGAVVIDREVTVNAGDLSSGVYFARASESLTRRSVATAKLVLIK